MYATMTRDRVRSACHAFLAASLLAVPQYPAAAAAPQARIPSPGFYRMMLGDFEVTVVSDGTFDLQIGQLLTNTTPEKTAAALARSFLKDPVETSVNTFLVNTGTKLVLIDAGAGAASGPTVGKLVANLRAAGYQPEQVDEVYITHMHGDHVGGLVSGEAMTFPNATVRVDRRDAEFWLSEASMNAAPKEVQGFFKGAMAATRPYAAAGKLKPFDGETELVPGITAAPAHGHTPGHTIYVVESQGQRLDLWGDLMHVASVQFAEPSVTIRFDADSKAAEAERAKQFASAGRQGYWVAAAHLPFPGVGHLRPNGSGYDWVPVNYARIR